MNFLDKQFQKYRHQSFILFVSILFSIGLQAQVLISGKVRGIDGKPIPNATIAEKDAKVKTGSDENGNYNLRVEKLPVHLVFSAIGSKTLEIRVTDQVKVNCVMEQSANTLKDRDYAKANLELLNLWGERPESINSLYKAALNVLSLNPSGATFNDLASDQTVQQVIKENKLSHWGGPLLGQIHPHGTSVWIRTIRPASVEVMVSIDGKEVRFGPVESSQNTDLSATVPIFGLKPGSTYAYKVLIDGQPIDVSGNTVIRTPLDDNTLGETRIVFGTCFHRWGLGNEKQVQTILGRRPAAMLLGGDVAVQDKLNMAGLHRADYLLRDFFPAWSKLVAEVPVYATWDDHDYFGDDLAGTPDGFHLKDKEAVWEVFRHAWNNPSYGFGEKEKGVFFRTRIGAADVIMLDGRYFRSGEKGSLLGNDQMKWLKEQLLQCKGPFIILSSGTMWTDFVSNGKDSWGEIDPEGREEIFKFIEDHKIGGVLLISGDRHGARGFQITRPSGFKLYEFEPGSLGGRSGPPNAKPEWNSQLFGYAGVYAFGEFTFHTSSNDPTAVFRLIDDDGQVLYELNLKRKELTPR